MRLNCAIFDMDGTLLDSMWKWDALGIELLRRHGREPRADFRDVTIPMGIWSAARYCVEEYGLDCAPEDLVEEMNTTMMDFYAREVRCKKGVEKFLAIMKMEGVSMYVASASERPMVETALKTAGIANYFKGIITCAEAGADKGESPKIYEYAMKRMRGNKLDTVVFEDSWAAIRTAKAAGFRVAGIFDNASAGRWEDVRALADYAYESWEELVE
ncbi:MAG: HAD family phosphatase [Oscillibacter sp.]|nr:HAD family phosphatase [Oscillibacter sp.]MBQ8850935.1 HAD family phosphatase [Oscillibacter sp.]